LGRDMCKIRVYDIYIYIYIGSIKIYFI
jgi:hypothetical protein